MGQYNTIPPNPFPPSSESAGGSGGTPYVLPVASDEELGGVMIDGAGLEVGENGLLSVKTGDGLYTNVLGELCADSQKVDYSTVEVDTGVKWIDGKSIYCRVFSGLTISSATSWKSTDIDISDIETIVDGVVIDNAGQIISSSIGGTTGDILLVRSAFDGNTITTIVVYYTKVTV